MGRCKSAPDRIAARPSSRPTCRIPTGRPDMLSSKMELDETTTTLLSTMGSRTGGLALGQGTIDQYFTAKIKEDEERVEMAQLPCSAIRDSTTSNVSQRSTCPRPSTSTSSRRPDPPSITTIPSTRRKDDIEPNVAEQLDDTQNDSRSSPPSHDSAGSTNATSSSSTVQGDPGGDKSKICECTISNGNSTSADSTETMSVRLLKKGKYTTRLSSLESKHVKEGRSRSSIHVLPSRMPYSCRTVLIPPGKVGAVLHTSPLGPTIKTVKKDSPIFDHVAAGDVVVEVDGIDTTSARAKEVTMMLINGAERERQIVVLSQETFDHECSRDDESIIEEEDDCPVDRYLGFPDDDDDRGDDDEARLSASIASGATTVAAGNTQAHNYKRAKCRENLAKKRPSNAKIRLGSLGTIKGAHSVREGLAEEPTGVREAPKRSMDAETLTSMSVGLESRRSAVMGGEGFPPAPASELTTNRSSPTPKADQVDPDYDDDKESFLVSPKIPTTDSETISSLSGSPECSQFGNVSVIGSMVHDEREKVPLSPIGEESTSMSHHDQGLPIGQDTNDQEVLLVIGERESNAIAGERTQPGFDLFLPRMGEEASTSLSTLTPSLAGCGGDEQTEISIDKLGEALIFDEPEKCVVADITVLVASTILSSGGNREIAKRAADSILSLCNESPTCVDFQSLASDVSLEILEAGGSQKCASCVVGAILTYQKGIAPRLNEPKKDGMATDQRECLVTTSLVPFPQGNLSPPSLLDVISAKPLAKQNTEHHRFFQGTEAVVSSLLASRDQIVQDALHFSSLLRQSTENFSANLLAPTSGSTDTTRKQSTVEEIAVKTSLPEREQKQIFNPNIIGRSSSQAGSEHSFSTYQLCCRTLIAAEGDTEVELFFPSNEFEELNLDRHVDLGQQGAPAETSNDGLNVTPARSGPKKSSATPIPILDLVNNGASKSRSTCTTRTCGSFDEGFETVPRSLLERWRSARRRQKAKRPQR